jgi:K+-transporting ATPase ATPase C chain
MSSILRPALVLFCCLSVLCGVLYPGVVAGIGRIVFPRQSAGSLVEAGGTLRGSTLIGQAFTAPRYFWGRPSATTPLPYNAAASSGSNLGPANPALADAVRTRIGMLRATDPDNRAPVPVDLVTASASGLDPEISVAAARYQAGRIAVRRALPRQRVDDLIEAYRIAPRLGFGEPRVNVLALNLALDGTTVRGR